MKNKQKTPNQTKRHQTDRIIVLVGRELQRSFSPSPCSKQDYCQHQIRSTMVLSGSEDGDFTGSQCNLFHGNTSLPARRILLMPILNLPRWNFYFSASCSIFCHYQKEFDFFIFAMVFKDASDCHQPLLSPFFFATLKKCGSVVLHLQVRCSCDSKATS